MAAGLPVARRPERASAGCEPPWPSPARPGTPREDPSPRCGGATWSTTWPRWSRAWPETGRSACVCTWAAAYLSPDAPGSPARARWSSWAGVGPSSGCSPNRPTRCPPSPRRPPRRSGGPPGHRRRPARPPTGRACGSSGWPTATPTVRWLRWYGCGLIGLRRRRPRVPSDGRADRARPARRPSTDAGPTDDRPKRSRMASSTAETARHCDCRTSPARRRRPWPRRRRRPAASRRPGRTTGPGARRPGRSSAARRAPARRSPRR